MSRQGEAGLLPSAPSGVLPPEEACVPIERRCEPEAALRKAL
jgi:hypothetical protein